MAYHQGLALLLIAVGLSPLAARDPPPQPANPRDARILFRLELPVVTVVVKAGRTVVYEAPGGGDRPQPRSPQRTADSQEGRPARPVAPMAMPPPERKSDQVPRFDEAAVEKVVKLLRAGGASAPLRVEPVRGSWLVRWADPEWGVGRGPDSVTVWVGAFDYEVVFAFRFSGLPAGAPPRLPKGE